MLAAQKADQIMGCTKRSVTSRLGHAWSYDPMTFKVPSSRSHSVVLWFCSPHVPGSSIPAPPCSQIPRVPENGSVWGDTGRWSRAGSEVQGRSPAERVTANKNTMQMSCLQQVALIRCCQMNSASLRLSPALASRSEALICSRCGLIYCDLANYCN